MAYSALAVANAFIEQGLRGNIKNLTPMKLQKLLFSLSPGTCGKTAHTPRCSTITLLAGSTAR